MVIFHSFLYVYQRVIWIIDMMAISMITMIDESEILNIATYFWILLLNPQNIAQWGVRGFKYMGVPDRGTSPITMDGVSNLHWSIAQIERGNLEYLIYFGVLQFDSYYSYSISTGWNMLSFVPVYQSWRYLSSVIPLLRGSDLENISSTEALIYINHTHVQYIYIYVCLHIYI